MSPIREDLGESRDRPSHLLAGVGMGNERFRVVACLVGICPNGLRPRPTRCSSRNPDASSRWSATDSGLGTDPYRGLQGAGNEVMGRANALTITSRYDKTGVRCQALGPPIRCISIRCN